MSGFSPAATGHSRSPGDSRCIENRGDDNEGIALLQ
jgi:hypothetical protein